MSPATPQQIRRITEDVLARPEFQPSPSDWTQILFQRLFDWFRAIARWSAQNPAAAKVLMLGLTILLLGLLAHIVYTAFREFGELRKSGRGTPGQSSPVALEGVAEDRQEAFSLAKAALECGDLYKALWIVHRILLSVLHDLGEIKFARWKTNSDYLQECRGAVTARALLLETTIAYERVIYAHNALDRTEAEKVLAEVEGLAAQASQ